METPRITQVNLIGLSLLDFNLPIFRLATSMLCGGPTTELQQELAVTILDITI